MGTTSEGIYYPDPANVPSRQTFEDMADSINAALLGRFTTDWTTLTSNLSSGTARYTVVAGWVQVQVDGAMSIATGTTVTVTTAAIPAELRPSIQVRSSGYFGGHPGTLTMGVDGIVTAVHQSGATRGSVSGVISYPVE